MAIRLYNTKSREEEVFSPINPAIVTMYACGPTVYDKTHIGHMRKYTGDDILKRTLTLLGYNVKHVMNITDVGHLSDDADTGEDKLEKGAKKEGKNVWDIAKYYTDYFHDSMSAINVIPPEIESKATDHVKEMIALVEKLIEKGYAYETSEAVYFDVMKDKGYGVLSKQNLDDKQVGVRDEVVTDTEKKHPMDFSLWFKRIGKFSSHSQYWSSPWGDGFPGWHIECSAMSMKYLGETIDIHTGGIDHIPVHHENEIAQSECATGHEFVKYWVHHEFLLVDGEKMSKSKNNFYTIEDIRAKGINPLATRLLFMTTHYRKPLNFTWEGLKFADKGLKKLQKFASNQNEIGKVVDKYLDAFKMHLEDDMNTPRAMAVLWLCFNDSDISDADKWATILRFDEVLGLDLINTPKFVISDEAKSLVEKRNKARAEKDWSTSDELRKELEQMGYEVLDTDNGTELN